MKPNVKHLILPGSPWSTNVLHSHVTKEEGERRRPPAVPPPSVLVMCILAV